MYLGVIADDFTGASDIANTLAKGGLATTQFLCLPSSPAPASCEVGVVSLKTRSIAADEAISQSLGALAWLKEQGCRQFIFKYCSTFDSTPRGNIGPVGEALASELQVRGVPACPAFPDAGRTVYQGHLFVGDRLLNESGLENHPLNPMTDPDIRRWLAAQSRYPVGLVPWRTVRGGGSTIRAALDDAAAGGQVLVIVDAVSNEDLIAIGEASAEARLLTGGSGIAIGLPRILIERGHASGRGSRFHGAQGPGAILAGSCSNATLGQVEVHSRSHPHLAVDLQGLMDGRVDARTIADFIREHREREPLVFSSASPDQMRAWQGRYGTGKVAAKLEGLFAEAARLIVKDGVERLVIAGGETSGAVVSGLSIDAVSIGPEIDPGVPALETKGGKPLALALKSGNFGAPDFFSKALRVLAGPA